jgi:hypothetical protein
MDAMLPNLRGSALSIKISGSKPIQRIPQTARVVKLVDTTDLKSVAYLHKGRTGSIPVSGTIFLQASVYRLKMPNARSSVPLPTMSTWAPCDGQGVLLA